MHAPLVTLFLGIVLLMPANLAAQQAPPPCEDDARRAAFDFWVGRWTVTNPAGATVGGSSIERVASGCAILETWSAGNGREGRSLNFFDPATDSWHQVWVGGDGVALRLEGDSDRPGRMILTGGPRETPNGTVRDRITWTLQDDGTVEQLWDISTDGGSTWQTGFRGIYRPAE